MKLVKFLVVTMMLLAMAVVAGCGGGDKISGTYYSQVAGGVGDGNYVEEMTITKEGDNYYMTGKRWRYKCNFNTQKAVEHFIAYNESIPKQQLKVDGNNIIINRTILGPAILTLKDGKLQGEELFGSETTFEKSTDVFKKSMAALLEKEKEEYKGFWIPQQIARKKSTVDNSKLEEALKAK